MPVPIAVILLTVAFAQVTDSATALNALLLSVRYPPLAEAARVQGEVRITLNAGILYVVSGPPLFRATALANAESLKAASPDFPLQLTYRFTLLKDATITPTSVIRKRGNALERAVLRVLRLPTEKTVTEDRCQDSPLPVPTEIETSGHAILIRVFGRARCLQTSLGSPPYLTN